MNWAFLFRTIGSVFTANAQDFKDGLRTYAHQNGRPRERELDAANVTLSVFLVSNGKQKKRGKPRRAVIPYGTETNIQLSLGESYSSLKIKASDSKQL